MFAEQRVDSIQILLTTASGCPWSAALPERGSRAAACSPAALRQAWQSSLRGPTINLAHGKDTFAKYLSRSLSRVLLRHRAASVKAVVAASSGATERVAAIVVIVSSGVVAVSGVVHEGTVVSVEIHAVILEARVPSMVAHSVVISVSIGAIRAGPLVIKGRTRRIQSVRDHTIG